MHGAAGAADGTPLCQLPGLAGRPHAYPKLWKHHAAQPQADRINALAHERGEPWIARYGGKISAEWQFAKALQLLDEDPEIYSARRPVDRGGRLDHLAAHRRRDQERLHGGLQGHPAGRPCTRRASSWPRSIRGSRASPRTSWSTRCCRSAPGPGSLTRQAAQWTGLPEGIAVAAGNVDAHVTAPAAGATEPGQMVAIMGTSTCHVMNAAELAEVPGMCGVVDGGIVAGLWGYEAGQSGVGRHLRLVRRARRAARLRRGGRAARRLRARAAVGAGR